MCIFLYNEFVVNASSYKLFYLDTLRIKLERGRKKRLKQRNKEEEEDESDFVIPLAEVTDSVEGNKTSKWDSKLTFQVTCQKKQKYSAGLVCGLSNVNRMWPTFRKGRPHTKPAPKILLYSITPVCFFLWHT